MWGSKSDNEVARMGRLPANQVIFSSVCGVFENGRYVPAIDSVDRVLDLGRGWRRRAARRWYLAAEVDAARALSVDQAEAEV